jgi:sugar O-acyltransferase (sialic acid O-acetyltransferase NeuD family)
VIAAGGPQRFDDAAGREIYLAGSGSFAIEIAEWAGDAGWRVAGLIELLDDARVGEVVSGHRIVGARAPAAQTPSLIALGGSRRAHWARIAGLGWSASTIVHPRAHVSPSATLAPGCIVGPAAVIGAESRLGAHTLVSRGALIGHHVEVGDYAALMPGANVGGHARIGEDTVVGMGAVIVNGCELGADVTVAAGAVVLGRVADGSRVQGVPAREYVP